MSLIYFVCFALFVQNIYGAAFPDIRIIGGDLVTIYDHPHQVALLHQNPSGVFALACGGAILRYDVILTAAQCTINTTPSQWRIKAGSSYHTGASGELVTVDRIIQHERFTGFPSMENDISLVFLTAELPERESIKVIGLPYQGVSLATGTTANITGWGATTIGGPASDILNRVTVTVVDQTRCASAYSGFVSITVNMLCAGVVGVGDKDFCSRDTGGPLVANNLVHGIASFGLSCGDPNYPGVYTRVSNYFNWINANIV